MGSFCCALSFFICTSAPSSATSEEVALSSLSLSINRLNSQLQHHHVCARPSAYRGMWVPCLSKLNGIAADWSVSPPAGTLVQLVAESESTERRVCHLSNYIDSIYEMLQMRMLLKQDWRAVLIPGHLLLGCRRCMSSSSKSAVMSFGDGSYGALGLPTSLTGPGGAAYEPTRVPGLPSDIISVSAGHYHSLAVTSQGELWAWGRNNEAQLGRGLLAPKNSWNEPKRVAGLNQVKVRSAFASGVISAAIGDDGSLWVWGKSKRGQLGLGKDIIETVVPSRVEALAGEKVAKVSLGWGHALAQTENGKLFGWGYSADGRIGKIGESLEASPLDSSADIFKNNNQLTSSTHEIAEKLVLEGIEKEKNMPIIWDPSLVEELHGVGVVDIACGLDHSLVLCHNGTLLSCGSNIYGQLGRVKQDLGMLPVDISFHPMSIASGLGHSLAICKGVSSEDTGGATSILSWGWNQSSQLGRAGPENLPQVVEALQGETLISVSGGRAHSFALTSNGEVWVWGCGKNGRLGLGSSADEAEPILLDYLEGSEVLQVVSGFDHNLVLIAE